MSKASDFYADPYTNADSIKAMNNEDLAKFIADFHACMICSYHDKQYDRCGMPADMICVKKYAYAITEDWLKKECD